MRLTCPNCDAEYEVPDDAIPTTGRDVQCSNCSNTWFQAHPDHPLEASQAPVEAPRQSRAEDWHAAEDRAESSDRTEDEDAANAPQDDAPIPDAAFTPQARRSDASDLTPTATPAPAGAMPEPDPADAGPNDDTEDAIQDSAPPPQTTLPELPARREIDPTVVSVLRAEAEREQRARAAASQRGPETQPEPGLTNGASDSHPAQAARLRPMARAESTPAAPAADNRDERDDKGDKGDRDQAAGVAPAARRSLYPAIEEINAAPPLQETAPQADAAAPPAKAQQRKAFRSGVLLALLIAVALLLVYLFAPQLADRLPPLSGALAAYSAWVDALRQWLDGQVAALMLWLDGTASPAPAGGDSSGG